MNIRFFVYVPFLLFFCLLQAKGFKGARPNIILVMTDDQGQNLSYTGHPVLRTPHIDKFAEQSLRFNEFHVSPNCAPTRAALISGAHEFRSGVTHTTGERELLALSTTTFPQLLQEVGYETGIFGKWHLGDIEAYRPGSRGFSEVLIHGAGGIGQNYGGSNVDFPPNQVKETRYFDNVTSEGFIYNQGIMKVPQKQPRNWKERLKGLPLLEQILEKQRENKKS